jgi:hypothetical protein
VDEQQLNELEALCVQATPGPWFVRHLDDSHSMNLVAVSTIQDRAHLPWPEYGHETIVAATLIQEPRYVDHAAGRWDEDAAFIAAARTAMPQLIAEVKALRKQ